MENSAKPVDDKKLLQLLKRLSEKYSSDICHADSVAKIALRIFDATRKLHHMGHLERILLQHSCLLHDIGSFISEKKHHWHSCHIILHDGLMEDYPEKERALVALIAFNHRKKLHKDTSKYSKAGREVILKLSAILRIADALTYSPEGYVAQIKSIHSDKNAVHIQIDGTVPEKVLARLEKKKKLFLEVFGLNILFYSLN